MNMLTSVIGCVLALGVAGDPEPAIRYFTHVRDVVITAPDRQNYIIVDGDTWAHARADLSDLRLYDGDKQVPYELKAETAGTSSHEADVKILNLARRGDHTEFDLDAEPVTEYNRIQLTLDRKNFLVTASVEGRDTLAGRTASSVPRPSTLFDFSREKLGSNSTISLPVWSFRYLHVRLSPGIGPEEVKGATVAKLEEKQAQWQDSGTCAVSQQQERNTLIACDVPAKTPIDRVQFEVPASQINFRRTISIADEKGVPVAAGSISRIRIHRGGTSVDTEELAISVYGEHSGHLTVTVDNGDDPPLAFAAIRPQSLQRRLWFEPQGRGSLKLYYGDDKLTAPIYDYAKFFREDNAAVRAQVGTEMRNPAFTGRPEVRPWSERHKAVLWIAMLLAVALLAILAVRGLRSRTSTLESH